MSVPTSSTRSMTNIALFVSLFILCSWITIPTPIPFTLQLVALYLACGLLRNRQGVLVVCLYLLLGFCGLPVFSGFRGGIGMLFTGTGGYLIGFLLTALILWIGKFNHATSRWYRFFIMTAGLIGCYTIGTLWNYYLYFKGGEFITAYALLQIYVIPFLIPDFIKIILSDLLLCRLKKYFRET